MVVAGVDRAGRVDVGPAAGDLERVVLDIEEFERAAHRRADDRRELIELRQALQGRIGLPGAADRNLESVGGQRVNFDEERFVQARGNVRL